MAITRTTNIVLDPHQHKEALKHFLRHFDISAERPSYEFLGKILSAYARLPYENISKIIKLNRDFTAPDRIRLPEEVISDHARYRFGGTCFSLSFFLQSILDQFGFISYIAMAHMRNRFNVHCAMIVLLENTSFLVDPGYLLTKPMPIHPLKSRLYRNRHTGVELLFNPDDEQYHLYTFDRQMTKWRYCFKNAPTPMDEFLMHWNDSFYQGTMHGICLTQVHGDGIVYLHNDYLQIATMEGKQKQRIKQNYHQTVSNIFHISPDLIQQAMEAIAKNMFLEKELGLYHAKSKTEQDAAERTLTR